MTDIDIVERILNPENPETGGIEQQYVLCYDGSMYSRFGSDIYKPDPKGKLTKQIILNLYRACGLLPSVREQENAYKLLLNDPRIDITDNLLPSYQIEGVNYFLTDGGLIWAKDAQAEAIEFIYDPYFPKGKLTLVAAYPGAGKTMLMMYFAAKVTQGLPFFGCSADKAHTVLYFSTEDGVNDTLKSRFSQAAGAEDRCAFYKGILTFDDVNRIRNLIDATGADVIVFDPLQSYASSADLNNAKATRQMFDRLDQVAQDKQITMIIVCHFNKNSKGDAITRIIGSTDIVGKARSYIAVGNIPGDTERKFFSHEKSNLARAGLTQIFRIDPDHGLIVPDGTTTKRYDDFYLKKATSHDDQLEAAKKLILENLNSDNTIDAKKAYQLAEDEGISRSTMKTARVALDMYTKRNSSFQGGTVWVMSEVLEPEDLFTP